jgi:bacteriorhodopsin
MGAIAISFLIFLVGTIIFIVKAYNSKEQSRYYFLAMYICAFSAMSYLAMLSGEGWIAITGCRQFFYARYAESLITFPLVTVLLGAISGSSADSIASAIGAAGMNLLRFNLRIQFFVLTY